jgi:hypothetical protein
MASDPNRLVRLRTGEICLDATVPRHLARCGRAAVVLEPLKDRLVWPTAVGNELRRAKVPNIPEVLSRGREIELTEEQDQDVEDLRSEGLLENVVQRTTTNLGEAAGVILCEAHGWPLIVHDSKGQQWADKRKVEHFDVIELLAFLASSGSIRPGQAWSVYASLCHPPSDPNPDRRGMFLLPTWIPGSPDCQERFMTLISTLAAIS